MGVVSDDPTTAPSEPGTAALAEYRRRTGRSMRIYAAVLVLIVVAAFVFVKVAYARGELNHTSAQTAPAATAVPSAATASTLGLRWQTADHPAGGDPYADGIVVTWSEHTVNGRDARTGAVRWHYTRSDQTICSVLQQDSSTIAIYRRDANCDEVTGFTTSTGATKWFRTLKDDGTTATASGPNVVLSVATNTVHVFDNAGGLDRWFWTAPAGCTVTRALAGTQGVLIGLDCAATHQLVLRGLIDDSTKWTITTATAIVPIGSGAVVAGLDPTTGAVHTYSTAKGADSITGHLTGIADLAAVAAALPAAATTVEGSDPGQQPVEYAWAGRLISLSANGKVRWSATAGSQPWLFGADLVGAGAAGQVVLHRSSDGVAQQTVALSGAPATARPYPVGVGVLVAGSTTALYS